MNGLRVNTVESLLQGIAVFAGSKLTVTVGDTVRVHLAVEYRGPAIDGEVHVSYGSGNGWFNEDGRKQSDTPVHFDESFDFAPYEIACDVPIGDPPGRDYDLYAKIMSVPGPDIFSDTLLNVLDVRGAAEFRDFAITRYEKV